MWEGSARPLIVSATLGKPGAAGRQAAAACDVNHGDETAEAEAEAEAEGRTKRDY